MTVAHTYTQLLYHVVFSTKNRLPLIDGEVQQRLYPYLGGIVRDLRGVDHIIGGMPDHVHLLFALPPSVCVADALRTLKANSSRWIHETWPEKRDLSWQTGYGAFSVSRSGCDTVHKYIANREEHHRHRTFKQELIAFLEKHGIEYDEGYIWE